MAKFLHRIVSNRSYSHRDKIFESEINIAPKNSYSKHRLDVPIIKELFEFIDQKVHSKNLYNNTNTDSYKMGYNIINSGVYI